LAVTNESHNKPVWQSNTILHPWQRLRRFTNFIFSWSTDDNHDPKAAHDISTVLWAAGFVLTQGVALMAAVRDTHPVTVIQSGSVRLREISSAEASELAPESLPAKFLEWCKKTASESGALLVYLLASAFPIAIMRTILRARVYSQTGTTHFFDRPTVASCRCMLLMSLFFVATVSTFAYAKALPGQTVVIGRPDFHPYTFKDRKDGIEILVHFRIEGMPSDGNLLNMACQFDDALYSDWRLANVQAFSGGNKDKSLIVGFNAEAAETARVDPFTVHKVAVGGRYTLKLLLKPKTNRFDREKALSVLRTDDKAIRIVVEDHPDEATDQPRTEPK
jgi:hypothetical protein